MSKELYRIKTTLNGSRFDPTIDLEIDTFFISRETKKTFFFKKTAEGKEYKILKKDINSINECAFGFNLYCFEKEVGFDIIYKAFETKLFYAKKRVEGINNLLDYFNQNLITSAPDKKVDERILEIVEKFN